MSSSKLELYKLDRWSGVWGEWPLFPDAVEEVVRTGKHFYSDSYNGMFVVNLILAGSICYNCGDLEGCEARAGDLFLIPYGKAYSFSTSDGGSYHKLVLEIRGSLLQSFFWNLHLEKPLLIPAPTAFEMEPQIRNIGAFLRNGRQEDVPAMFSEFHGVISRLSLFARGEPEEAVRLVSIAKAKLENDMSNSLSIEALASELGICHSMLDRLFRKKVGMSPLNYRIKQKMSIATNMLVATSIPIKEISLRLGYSNQLYFSNEFKARFGVSPRNYRLKNSQSGKS